MSKPAFRIAIELLKKAKKTGAEPALIAMLEKRVKDEAEASYARLKAIESNFPVISTLTATTKLSDSLR